MSKLVLLSLAACSLPPVDGPGPPGCISVDTEIAADDASALGFSANDVTSDVEGEWHASGAYFHSELPVGVTFVASRRSDPVILRTWDRPPGAVENCQQPSLIFTIGASFTMDDGTIDESWTQEIETGTDFGFVTFGLVREVGELSGSLDLSAFDELFIWNNVYPSYGIGDIYGATYAGVSHEGDTGDAADADGYGGFCIAYWSLSDVPCEER